jgi:hypothetical protein
VFLDGRDEVCKGQLAHLNRDPSDSRFENLVWLCLNHHDEYDGRTSQSKGLTSPEVKVYRDQLYARHSEPEHAMSAQRDAEIPPLPPLSDFELVRRKFSRELAFLNGRWEYPLWQIANQPEFFAYKAQNGSDGVCLIERIDLPDRRIVVACMAVAGNPGVSITNAVEEICFQVCERFQIPPHRLIWLEHYDSDGDDEWNMVTFGRTPPDSLFSDPRWTSMTGERWGQLMLRPVRTLAQENGHLRSKLTKLFHWPTEALLNS